MSADYSSESDADKRAHSNAIERKRRDEIELAFSALKDAAFADQGGKVKVPRSEILRKAAEEIQSRERLNENLELITNKITELTNSCQEAVDKGDAEAAIDIFLEMNSLYEEKSHLFEDENESEDDENESEDENELEDGENESEEDNEHESEDDENESEHDASLVLHKFRKRLKKE